MTSVPVLVEIGVNGEGYHEILGAAEGASESKESFWNRYQKSSLTPTGNAEIHSVKRMGYQEEPELEAPL